MGLLALIPLKDKAYFALIVILGCGFWWYSIHEREIGEAKIEAADKAAVDAREQRNAAVLLAAQATSNAIGDTFEKTVSAPPVKPLGLVCRAPRGSAVPGPANNRPETPGAPDSGATVTFDPSGPALTVGRDSDAQVNGLLDYIATIRQELKQ